jgi:hypothetical protein
MPREAAAVAKPLSAPVWCPKRRLRPADLLRHRRQGPGLIRPVVLRLISQMLSKRLARMVLRTRSDTA